MFNRIQVILSAQHDLQTNESVSDHKKKKLRVIITQQSSGL